MTLDRLKKDNRGVVTAAVMITLSVIISVLVSLVGLILVDTNNNQRSFRNIVAANAADAGIERAFFLLNHSTAPQTCADLATTPPGETLSLPGGSNASYLLVAATTLPNGCRLEFRSNFLSPGGATIATRFARIMSVQTINTGVKYAAQAGNGGLQTYAVTTIASPVPGQKPDVFSGGEIIFSNATVTNGDITAADNCISQAPANPCNLTGTIGSGHISIQANGSSILGAAYSRYEYNANVIGGNPVTSPTLCAISTPPGITPTQLPNRVGKRACEQESDPSITGAQALPVVATLNQQLSHTDTSPTSVPGPCPGGAGSTYTASGLLNWGGSGEPNYFNCNVDIGGPGTIVNIHGPVHITGTATLKQGLYQLSNTVPGFGNFILLLAEKNISLQAGAVFNGELPATYLVIYSRWCNTSPIYPLLNNCGTNTPTDTQLFDYNLWSGGTEAINILGGIQGTNVGVFAGYGLLKYQADAGFSFAVGQRIEMRGNGNISFNLPIASGNVVTYGPSGYTISGR